MRGGYHRKTVYFGELRENLNRYIRRVERGERLVITDRNRPVAELGPPPSNGTGLDLLILEGRVSRPCRGGLPEPSRQLVTRTRSVAHWTRSAG